MQKDNKEAYKLTPVKLKKKKELKNFCSKSF